MSNRATTVLPFRVFILLFLLSSLLSNAQQTGYINRPATAAAGRTVLDPDGNSYTSKLTSGFGTDDLANSEIPYKIVPSFAVEPYGDLRRGPDHLYSDFVPDNGDDGFYAFSTGTNLLFRFRMGSVMAGSKGYTVLLDTDSKFGSTGPNADPNFQPATTGVNGNPGFEIEIVLETNFRIAIYNVDGTSNPTLLKAYTNWQDMSQVSIAGTYDNGDPDFFMDFYIPVSDLQGGAFPFNITSSTPLRMGSTTVMAPKAAIGGPKSDIYGLIDDAYGSANTAYEAYIRSQPAFTLSDITSSGGGIGSVMCTTAPTLNSPVGPGTNITGSWTKSPNTASAGTANITVYKNGNIVLGTVSNVASGSNWTLTAATISANGQSISSSDVITARAQATGESMCQTSNSVTASNCSTSNLPAKPTFACADLTKGITGTNLSSGWVVYVENLSTGFVMTSTQAGTTITITGSSPNMEWKFGGGCASGNPMEAGSFRVYYKNASTGCNSEPAFFCVNKNGGTTIGTAPQSTINISDPSTGVFTTATKRIAGTATDAGATVTLYIGNIQVAQVTSGASREFAFENLTLASGSTLFITSVKATGTVSTSSCLVRSSDYSVNCNTTPPLINADNNNQITAGQPITGISSEPTGTTIRVYTAANALVATVTVQSDGTWTTGSFNAAASTSYYARAQNGSCIESVASGTVAAVSPTSSSRCASNSITGPVSATASSVSGSLASAVTSTTVRLYLDGIAIGSVNTDGTTWAISVNTTIDNKLYANGVLTIGIQESGKQEVACSASQTITCSPTPAAPIISPTNTTIGSNSTVTYTISNAVTGTFYGLADAATGASMGPGKWATADGSLQLTTKSFSGTGSYDVVVKSSSLSSVTVCNGTPSAAKVVVDQPLPLTFLSFKGVKESESVLLKWNTEQERNTSHFIVEHAVDGVNFYKVGEVAAAGSGNAEYSYIHKKPVLKNNYYRLKSVDKDGTVNLSKVVVIYIGSSASINMVKPNPFVNEIVINLTLNKKQKVEVQVTDAAGREVKKQVFIGAKGTTDVRVTDLQELKNGLYIVRVVTEEDVLQQKLIKASHR